MWSRELGPHTQARATAIQPGTLEIFARAGVLDRVLAESVQLRFARLFDAHLRQVGETAFAGAGCPWEFQCSLPQWRTERILADRLVELGATWSAVLRPSLSGSGMMACSSG